jgi:hypothetical protein
MHLRQAEELTESLKAAIEALHGDVAPATDQSRTECPGATVV